MRTHTVVLGAGFSYEFGRLPLVDDLGERVREHVAARSAANPELAAVFASAPPRFERGSFERWLSRIAEPQPDLDDARNLSNQHAFSVVTRSIHAVLRDFEQRALTPNGLAPVKRLVTCWHALQATVITFNYDTLVERAASEIVDASTKVRVNTYSVLNNLPPEADPPDFGYQRPSTLRVLKLHGSLDTFWVPGDASGATISRLGETTWDARTGATGDAVDLERVMPGRVPFIVPPASAKSALFGNPITRQLWRTAADRLAHSNSIDVVGYSLPMTDLVANAMIAESYRAAISRHRRYGETRIMVANPDSSSVVKSLIAAGVDGSAIDTVDSIEAYTSGLERELAAEHRPALLAALAAAPTVHVRAADGRRFAVVEVRVEPERVVLNLRRDASVLTGRDIAAAIESSAAPELITYFKGGRSAVFSHSTDDDGALVLSTTVAHDYDLR